VDAGAVATGAVGGGAVGGGVVIAAGRVAEVAGGREGVGASLAENFQTAPPAASSAMEAAPMMAPLRMEEPEAGSAWESERMG
jgi:hypothetical protein